MTDDRCCWTCDWQQIGGATFLGKCRWFQTIGQDVKDIPPHVVDVGCKHWRPRAARAPQETT